MSTAPVDVLIPTYNPKPEHLTAALRSLQAQTHPDWKALIHDDCSPNNATEEIVKPFLSDPRIRFVKSEKRLGIGGNWNACLTQTSEPVVAYLFQDDLWHPDYLASALRILKEHPSVGFVSLDHKYRSEDGMTSLPLYASVRTFKKDRVSQGLHRGKEFLRFWIENELHPNVIGEPDFVVLRRTVMERAGPFLEDMPQFLDTEYWLRLIQISDWYNLADREYGVFRIHPSAASAVNQMAGQGLFDRLRCFERLMLSLDGEDRTLAEKSRNRAVESMVAKYFDRMGRHSKISAQGGGMLWKFCLRHPMLIARSIVRYFLSGK